MKKLNRSLVDRDGRVDTSYEIYLALYQAIMGGEDREPIYDKFPRDFFDLIVIDECHRGSAADDAAWREVLCVLRLRDPARDDGDSEGDEVRLEHPLLR